MTDQAPAAQKPPPPDRIRLYAVDLETTGDAKTPGHTVIEFGVTPVLLDRNPNEAGDEAQPRYTCSVGDPESWLCRPGRAISFGAMGVHGITLDDIPADAEFFPATFARARLGPAVETPDPAKGARVLAAHNAAFEQHFIRPDLIGTPAYWICTYRCAYVLFPDCEGYSQGSLLYEFASRGLLSMDDVRLSRPAHRAGPDSYGCALLLSVMLRTHSARQLIDISSGPLVLRTLSFGMHEGKPVETVPRSYWEWILNQRKFDDDVEHTARQMLGYNNRQRDDGESAGCSRSRKSTKRKNA